jgi:hypothetical protein
MSLFVQLTIVQQTGLQIKRVELLSSILSRKIGCLTVKYLPNEATLLYNHSILKLPF